MKKLNIFLFSSSIALGIAYYSKKSPDHFSPNAAQWKTFEKNSDKKISKHQSTPHELFKARIPGAQRSIASEKNNEYKWRLLKDRHYQFREGRILFGETETKDYQNEKVELEMINKFNPLWDEILGNDLLRFHLPDTKVIIKDEYPLIKIQNGKGLYTQQVIVTYLFADGNFSSFHALVDSDTGFVLETWDRSINEKAHPKGTGITMPEINNSGIITR